METRKKAELYALFHARTYGQLNGGWTLSPKTKTLLLAEEVSAESPWTK